MVPWEWAFVYALSKVRNQEDLVTSIYDFLNNIGEKYVVEIGSIRNANKWFYKICWQVNNPKAGLDGPSITYVAQHYCT